MEINAETIDEDKKFIIRSNRRKNFASIMEPQFSRFFFISGILKLIVTILSVVILIIVARFGVDYTLIIMISTCICSFFYIAISLFADLAMLCLLSHAMSQCQIACYYLRAFQEKQTAQFLSCVLLLCGWLISMGISISHSLRAGADSTEPFAWIGIFTLTTIKDSSMPKCSRIIRETTVI
uniref:Uncharacterized protein n=1 Tax=Romanomermis culicivorax TaxID=13658 RepID=A0A915J9N9_ROMCU